MWNMCAKAPALRSALTREKMLERNCQSRGLEIVRPVRLDMSV